MGRISFLQQRTRGNTAKYNGLILGVMLFVNGLYQRQKGQRSLLLVRSKAVGRLTSVPHQTQTYFSIFSSSLCSCLPPQTCFHLLPS